MCIWGRLIYPRARRLLPDEDLHAPGRSEPDYKSKLQDYNDMKRELRIMSLRFDLNHRPIFYKLDNRKTVAAREATAQDVRENPGFGEQSEEERKSGRGMWHPRFQDGFKESAIPFYAGDWFIHGVSGEVRSRSDALLLYTLIDPPF